MWYASILANEVLNDSRETMGLSTKKLGKHYNYEMYGIFEGLR